MRSASDPTEERLLANAPPRTWVLVDDRPGNTSQSIGLANALGWPYNVVQLAFRAHAVLHNRILGASRLGLSRALSAPLDPPWPDLVIAAGRRSAPVAQWIRAQNRGRTKLVQLGRKGGDAAHLFDLVVTPAYCQLLPHPNRIVTSKPLHTITSARLVTARKQFEERLARYDRPRVGVLVGGRSGQYDLLPRTAQKLGEDVVAFAREIGGSVLASTSRRVSARGTDAFCAALRDNDYVYRWSDGGENPYLALLALSDILVVTGDSESMLAEATAVGCPVFIYDLPARRSFQLLRIFRDFVATRAVRDVPSDEGDDSPRRRDLLASMCRRMINLGLCRPTRDLGALHADLVRRGIADWFGSPGRFMSDLPIPNATAHELDDVAERVRKIVGMV